MFIGEVFFRISGSLSSVLNLSKFSYFFLSLPRTIMFEFGDELIINSYRIPWLIWIQLLAMFLLVILLYFLTTTPSDQFSTASPSSSAVSYGNRSFITANTRHDLKVAFLAQSTYPYVSYWCCCCWILQYFLLCVNLKFLENLISCYNT